MSAWGTVVARLHASVAGDPWVYPHLVADPSAEPTITLTLADAKELAELIFDLCPDSESCELCGEERCTTCGVGEDGWCPHGLVVCPDCSIDRCAECCADAGDDHDAEVYEACEVDA